MNTKTLNAVIRHGNALLAAFPNASERDPVALCKKLRRAETAISSPILDYCNGDSGMTSEKLDELTDRAKLRVCALLGIDDAHPCGLFVNRDPRGYALKFSDDYRLHLYTNGINVYSDMGGYGILAPDLSE